MAVTNEQAKWSVKADKAFNGLLDNYWNKDLGMLNNHYPNPDNRVNHTFHYWWYAHAIDSLVDAYHRTQDSEILDLIEKEYKGLIFRNGGQPTNLLYDDMEWLALALLRAYEISNNELYLTDAKVLWDDIKTGWNDTMGGGIAWHKDMLHYKNTPANGPASILAARFYKLSKDEEDLDWAKKIFAWLDENLVDSETGFVEDGMNRQKDGKIDHWDFTYCQGVYIGAAVELYRLTDEQEYLDKALLTANTAIDRLHDEKHNVLQGEGDGDGGLFKGIMIRYMIELIAEAPEQTRELVSYLEQNGETLWTKGRDEETNTFNELWAEKPNEEKGVSLSVQLSALMLFEMLAVLERN